MGSTKTTTQHVDSTQKNAPPDFTAPGLTNAGQLVTAALAANQGLPAYTGDFQAQMDPARVAQTIAAYDAAAGASGDMAGFAKTQMEQLFAPRDDQALLQQAIQASINPVFRNLQEQVLPGITNSALMSGAYTNDRALGVVPGQAISEATRSAQEIAAQLGYQGYQAEEDRRLQRAGLLPDLTNLIGQMSAAKGDIINAGTSLDQQLRQGGIDNTLAKHEYGLTSPYERIAPAVQLLTAISGNYGTQTGQQDSLTKEKTGGLGSILQGVLGAASMAASLGAFGPMGAAMGAAGGIGGGAGSLLGSLFKPQATPVSDLFGMRRG